MVTPARTCSRPCASPWRKPRLRATVRAARHRRRARSPRPSSAGPSTAREATPVSSRARSSGAWRKDWGRRSASPASEAGTLAAPRLSLVVAGADEGHGYETVFFVRPAGRRRLDLDSIRDHLGRIGESVIVAGDGTEAKVHIHNERPDEVIGYGLSIGTLTDVTVVNLDHQSAEVRDRRVAELVATGGPADGPGGIEGPAKSRRAATPPSIWIDPRARNGAT